VTDGAPGPARVPRTWRTYGEFVARASEVGSAALPPTDVDRLTYFCVAVPRVVWDEVGPLDEGFGIGMFEDDDHVARVRAAGYRVVLARDVLVAHLGEATLGTLAPTGLYGELFHHNRRRFESIHGPWHAHELPEDLEYRSVVQRLRDMVHTHVPPGAAVVVASKGDPALVELEGRTGRHFPEAEDGGWAGHHPADGPDAIDRLERTAARGDRFVLIPGPQAWWLDSYDGLREHLDRRYRTVVADDAGTLFELVGT
jgi:hypothetical protein